LTRVPLLVTVTWDIIAYDGEATLTSFRRNLLIGLLGSTALVSATSAHAAACSTPYVQGDVFASAGSGKVDVFTPTGTLDCTLNDGIGSITTGTGFDKAGNFYVTNFGAGGVTKFNNSGGLVAGTFMAPGGVSSPESINNVSTGPFAGSSFVGGPDTPAIDQFNTATGALIHTFNVMGGNGTNGTDWTDMALDGHTILYDGEGTAIRSYNLSTMTQNADFTSAATEAALDHIFAFRVIPTGADAGDVLVANSIDAVLLDTAGDIIKTYTLPGDGGGDFALNLDPNGTDFWTGDFASDNLWDVNIATGAIVHQFNAGTGSSTLYGVSVFGEITSGGGGGPTVPEPSTWAMMLVGFAGLGFMGYRKAKSGRTAVSAT
jgi:PEP-CTERM motif